MVVVGMVLNNRIVHMVTVLEVNRIVHTVVELNNKYDCGTGMEAINIMIVMELK